jgi:transposase
MDHIGIDVHKKTSQVCLQTKEGELWERRVATTREALAKLFADRERAKILMEASTDSEWVARWLEELGHEVIVADPNMAVAVRSGVDASPRSRAGTDLSTTRRVESTSRRCTPRGAAR